MASDLWHRGRHGLAKRSVETIGFTLAPGERALYDAISSFVRSILRRPGTDVHRAWYFTLLTLQKEVGSSVSDAAHPVGRVRASETGKVAPAA